MKASIILFLFCLAFSFVVIPSLAISPSSFGPVEANLPTTYLIRQAGNRPVASPFITLASLAQPKQDGTAGSGPKAGDVPLASATSPGLNAWTELGPKPLLDPNMQSYGTAPFSGRVTAVAINGSNPSNIYLGAAQGGVWKSLDGGTSWAPLTDSLSSLAIGAITISPDGKTLYAGTGEPNHSGDSYYGAGLYKSVDGGRSWTVLGSISFSNAAISGIVINQASNRILVSTTYAVCCKIGRVVTSPSAEGVFLSTDGGSTWSSTLSSPAYGVAQLLVDPSNQNTVYAADFTGAVWISTDAGSTWTELISFSSPALQGRVAVAASAALADNIFATFADSSGELIGVFRYNVKTNTVTKLSVPSTPTGQDSVCNAQCYYDLLLVSDPSNSNFLYLGTIDLFRSSDGGNSWTDIGGYSGTIHPDQHGFAILQGGASSTIFSGNDGGIWKSGDRGTTWTNLNKGLSTIQFESITGSPGSLLFGGTQDNGCDQYTGSSWSIIQGGDGGWTGFESSNPDIMYCNYAFLQFQKSTDGGKTWNPANMGINLNETSLFYAPVAQDPNTSGTIYLAGTRVYKTTNFAQSWTEVSGILGSSPVTALTVAPSNSNWVYLGDYSGAVKLSRDGGATWQQILAPQNLPVTGLAVDPTKSSVVYASFAHLGLYSVSLVGSSWQSTFLNAPQANVNVVRLDQSTKTIFIGTDIGVYYSTDSGSTWASPGTGLPNSAVFDLDFASATHTLVAATHGRGVWSLVVTLGLTMTLSYSVLGGGSGYSAPTLSYTSGGQAKVATLTGSPTPFTMDTGSSWNVTATLVGSTASERWRTNQATTGTPATQPMTFVYYHQYHVDVSGGTVSEEWFSAGSTAKMNTTGVSGRSAGAGSRIYSYSLDGGIPTAVAPTAGIITVQIIMNGPHSLLFNTLHQFELILDAGAQRSLLSVVQPTITGDNYWYDTGTTVTYTGNGIFERASGSGARAASWSLDSGPSKEITTGGTFSSNSITMTAPHTLHVTVVTQYHVNLDQGAAAALKSITPPTLSQDDNWYDAGTGVQVDLNGVWNRASGSGSRLVSYAINGGAPATVDKSGGVTVLSTVMGSAQSITTSVITQYLLDLHSGSLVSLTSPTLQNDVGWYDSGTVVGAVYNYVWNVTQSSRVTGFAYTVDASANTDLPRRGNGTFAVSLVMDKPHTINIASISQFRLDVFGGSDVAYSVPSPIGEIFYDTGTYVSVSTARTWNVQGGSRQNLVSYTLDGSTTNVNRAEVGGYNTPPIFMDRPHVLSFNQVTQHLITLSFTDDSGTRSITPSVVEIDIKGVGVQMVNGSKVWIDSGGAFAIAKLVWESADVRPTNPQSYDVSSPSNATIRSKVFDLTLRVTDLFGLSVSGARVSILLANGTRIDRSTGSDGKVSIPLIPVGTFNGTVTNLGVSSQVYGDASTSTVSDGKAALSIPVLGIVVSIIVLAVAGVFLGVRRRHMKSARCTPGV